MGCPISRKHIVFVLNSSFPHYSGGRETWLYNVSKLLDEQGYHVYIIALTNTAGRPLHFPDLPDSIELISCPTLRDVPVLRHALHGYMNIINTAYYSWRMTQALRRRFAGIYRNCVFISLDTLHAAKAVWRLKKRYPDLRFVCSCRGPAAHELSARFPLLARSFYRLERRSFQMADEIWANGKDTQADIA